MAQVSVFGVQWPLYKLVALRAAALIALAVFVLTGSHHAAILLGAASAAAVLIAGAITRQRGHSALRVQL